jgi:hypothetical protein
MEAPHNGTLESRKRAAANVQRPHRSPLLKKERKKQKEEKEGKCERREGCSRMQSAQRGARSQKTSNQVRVCLLISSLH